MENSTVDIQKLKIQLLETLDELQKAKGRYIEVKEDYYWDISQEDIYNPYKEPTVLTLGQFSDDIEELKNINRKPISYDLKRISSLIRVLSNNIF